MSNMFFIALRTTVVTLLLTGFIYPFVVTGISQVVFPHQANGSLVRDDQGRTVGSKWIGQSFSNAGYFWSRPSAAGNDGYDATASSGSNLGTTSQKLRDRIVADVDRLQAANPQAGRPVPIDLVTASASGLDPHVSPDAAMWQLSRVASARKVAPERIRQVVAAQMEGRDIGFFGEARVNVLLLNLALDRQFGKPAATTE